MAGQGQLIKPPISSLVALPSRATTVRGLSSADWFGPLEPLKPTAPMNMQPRQFEFLPGQNLIWQPRADEPISFQDLIYMADNCDLVRIVIEALKDSICLLPWQIRVKANPGETEKQRGARSKSNPKVAAWTEFLSWPNPDQTWADWLRMLLEDLFVLDAPSILLQRNRKKKIGALRVIDGQTINRIIDDNGFTPLAPNPAYQQILYGQPAVDLTVDDLVYRPRVQRARKLYGFSPVEQILLTLNVALRRMRFQLNAYTEGNVPEALYTMPAGVTEDQVKKFQGWFDQQLSGNLAARRRIWFIPGDDKGVNRLHFTKDQLIKDAADEWFVRVICFAFRVSPKEFIQVMNRATAESSADSAQEMGVQSICQWIADTMNYVIQRKSGDLDIEFTFSQRRETDILKQAQVDQIYVNAGINTRNEIRENKGDDPSDDPQANVLATAAAGFAPLDLQEQSAQASLAQTQAATQQQAQSSNPADGEEDQPSGMDDPSQMSAEEKRSLVLIGEGSAPEPKGNNQSKVSLDDLSKLSDEELKRLAKQDDEPNGHEDTQDEEQDLNDLLEDLTAEELKELLERAEHEIGQVQKYDEDEHPRGRGGKWTDKDSQKKPVVVDRHTRSGGQGQGMNWIRPHKRLAIYMRDGVECAYCQNSARKPNNSLTLDHLTPHSHGGSNAESNLVTACKSCNSERGNKPWQEFAGKKAAARIAKLITGSLDVDRAKKLIESRTFREAVQAAKKRRST